MLGDLMPERGSSPQEINAALAQMVTPPRAPLYQGCCWCYKAAGVPFPRDATAGLCPRHQRRLPLEMVYPVDLLDWVEEVAARWGSP